MIKVNFNAGFDDDDEGQELPSSNTYIDANNMTNVYSSKAVL